VLEPCVSCVVSADARFYVGDMSGNQELITTPGLPIGAHGAGLCCGPHDQRGPVRATPLPFESLPQPARIPGGPPITGPGGQPLYHRAPGPPFSR